MTTTKIPVERQTLLRKGWSNGSRGGLARNHLYIPGEKKGGSGGKKGFQRSQFERKKQAVFKIIKNGGCQNSAALKRQMNYVLGKADFIIDPSMKYHGESHLSQKAVNELADKWSEKWEGKLENGHSMHMVMSFPIGTPIEKVIAISDGVTSEVIGQGYNRFDYVVGIHNDKDHVHAHIIVDRRNEENELFYFAKHSEFTFDRFKDAMVDWGAECGVELANSSRYFRGLVTAPLKDHEYRNAKKGFVTKAEYAEHQTADGKKHNTFTVELATKNGTEILRGKVLEEAYERGDFEVGDYKGFIPHGKDVKTYNFGDEPKNLVRNSWQIVDASEDQPLSKPAKFTDEELAELKTVSEQYREIAQSADATNRAFAEGLLKMADALEELSSDTPTERQRQIEGEARKAFGHVPEKLINDHAAKVQQTHEAMKDAERRIEKMPPEARPSAEKQFFDVVDKVRETLPTFRPLNVNNSVLEARLELSVYAPHLNERIQDVLRENPDRYDQMLNRAGIDPSEFKARISLNTDNPELISKWVEKDYSAIIKEHPDIFTNDNVDKLDRIMDELIAEVYDSVSHKYRKIENDLDTDQDGIDFD